MNNRISCGIASTRNAGHPRNDNVKPYKVTCTHTELACIRCPVGPAANRAAEQDDRDSGPAAHKGELLQSVLLLPHEKSCDRRYQQSVAVFGLLIHITHMALRPSQKGQRLTIPTTAAASPGSMTVARWLSCSFDFYRRRGHQEPLRRWLSEFLTPVDAHECNVAWRAQCRGRT